MGVLVRKKHPGHVLCQYGVKKVLGHWQLAPGEIFRPHGDRAGELS